jgi:hypothetical protein
MNAFKHAISQPFIFATALAAFIHTTWGAATLFSGLGPQMDLDRPETIATWLWWVLPGALIAFALDVGQIATSAEIRAGHHNKGKYITFTVFAIATYFLQWLYMAHHMPALPLSDGVRQEWTGIAQLMRDAALWFIPALLPASTIAYTFSNKVDEQPQPPAPPIEQSIITTPIYAELPRPLDEDADFLAIPTSHPKSSDNGHRNPVPSER